MNDDFIKYLADSTSELFGKMIGLRVSIGEPGVAPSSPRYEVSAVIGMTGALCGSVVLSFPRAVAAEVVAKFAGGPIDQASPDFADAIGELANMICGAAKTRLATGLVNISCPSVIIGSGHSLAAMSDTVTVTIPCRTEVGDFSVDLVRSGSERAKAA